LHLPRSFAAHSTPLRLFFFFKHAEPLLPDLDHTAWRQTPSIVPTSGDLLAVPQQGRRDFMLDKTRIPA